MTKKIGFFGGTFDPPHFGHLHLAIEMMEIHRLDEVWFCPAFRSPHKAHQECAAPQHRIAMVEKAISGVPAFKLQDCEAKQAGVSYTIDTLKKLATPHAIFHLILGEDSLEGFSSWKEAEALLALAPPLIGSRIDRFEHLIKNLHPSLRHSVIKGFTSIPLVEISSTLIRRRLIDKKYCGHLLPGKVLDYIHQNQLY
jgi:nicotinate-nucleotide adenylyltransferase